MGGFQGAREAQKVLYSQEHFYTPGCSVLVLPQLGRGGAHAPLCGMCCVTRVQTRPFLRGSGASFCRKGWLRAAVVNSGQMLLLPEPLLQMMLPNL